MDHRKARVVIDEALFQRIAGGDSKALDDLYELSYRPIFALLLSYTQNYQDAEDLLQETFLKIYQGARLYKPRGNPMAWMMKIARNLYLSYYHVSERNLTNFEEMSNQIPFDNIPQAEDRLLIETMFQTLKVEERNIIVLHIMQGFKFREISDILDKPLGSVLSSYHRGLRKLKKASEEEE